MATQTTTFDGEKFAALRVRAGLSMVQLGLLIWEREGKETGYPVMPKTIGAYELRKIIPGSDRLAVIADVFDELIDNEEITVDSLFRTRRPDDVEHSAPMRG